MTSPTTPPTPMEDLTGAFVKLGAVVAARKLDLFALLAERPRSLTEMASRLSADPNGLHVLADELVGAGYLQRNGETYANAPIARSWLEPGSDLDMSEYLSWLGIIWPMWERLHETVRQGGPKQTIWRQMRDHPEWGRTFARYLRSAAHLNAELIVQAVPLPQGVRRFLDLGGGHGVHSIAFCRRYPDLNAVVFDLPLLAPVVEETVAGAALADRIRFQGGDYLQGPLGSGYDVVFCSDIFHNHTQPDSRQLVGRSAAALAPGGLFVCYGLFREDLPEGLLALVDLVFFMESATRVPSYADMASWLEAAGLGALEKVPITSVAARTLLVSRKPA
jgi:SAM-dependent methyltransferase